MRRQFGYGLSGLGAIDRSRMGAGGLLAAEYAEAGIPANYSPTIEAALDYQKRYTDLAPGSDAATYWRHFVNYGWYEGRRWDFTKGVTVPVVVAPIVQTPPIATPQAIQNASQNTLFGIPVTYLLVAVGAFFPFFGEKIMKFQVSSFRLLVFFAVCLFPFSLSAQQTDRITRPCSTGATPRAEVITNPNSTGNVAVTTCTGGALTVNGTPVTSGATINPTNNVIPYRSNATTFSDSPLTRSSATVINSTAALLTLDGGVNNAAFSFTAEPTLGWIRSSAGRMMFTSAGSVGWFDATGYHGFGTQVEAFNDSATSADGFILDSNGSATAGVQKLSPRLRFLGSGWKTDATAGPQPVEWIQEVLPVQGTANPSGTLRFSSQINTGGYVPKVDFSSGGSYSFTFGVASVNDKVSISNIGTVGGTTNAGGTKWALVTATGSSGLTLSSDSSICFNSSTAGTGTNDTCYSRNAAGVHQFGTTAANDLGSVRAANFLLRGSTSGTLTLKAAAFAGTNTITFPAGTTNFSSTGGTSRVVQQTTSGGAFTVAQLACADLSDAGSGCTGTSITNGAAIDVIPKSDGTNLVASRITDATDISIDSQNAKTIIGDVVGAGTTVTVDDSIAKVSVTNADLDIATGALQVGSVVVYSQGVPGITGNATLDAGSKDSAGKITSTGTGASTAVITFSITFTRAPACFVTNETTSNLVRPVSTVTTLTINATVVTGDSIAYACIGY